MSILGQIACIAIVFLICFFYLRAFLNGIKRYQLNKGAYKKRKQGETAKEWLLYSRHRAEIPKVLLVFYYVFLLIHTLCLVVCVYLHIAKINQGIGEVITKAIIGYDVVWVLIIALLFWSPGRDYAYERWITKKRGQKRGKK